MAGVYSVRFILSAGGPTGTKYVVPAGKRAVIKTVTGLNGSSTATNVYLYLAGSAIWAVAIPGLVGALSTGLHIVANELEEISVSAGHSNCGYSVHGYLLDQLA